MILDALGLITAQEPMYNGTYRGFLYGRAKNLWRPQQEAVTSRVL
jgi:hypothetical protein